MATKRTNANVTAKVTKNSVIEEINKFRKENGLSELTQDQTLRTTGENGIDVGYEVEFTGEINLNVPVVIDGKTTSTYIGVNTTSGRYISLARIMGISALGNYKTDGEYDHKTNGTLTKVTAKVVEDFDFKESFQPTTRNLYEFAAFAKETNFFANKSGKLLGKVVYPFNAKKKSTLAFDKYDANDPRCMTATLWKIG